MTGGYTNINKQRLGRTDRRTYAHTELTLFKEVHTETTMNKRITSNPQRTQKTKVTSSYDSRNNILIFPPSLSELSTSCRPKSRRLVWVQPATLLNSFFILQKVWINKLWLILWPLAFTTMKARWREKETCSSVCISHACTCSIWMCVCVESHLRCLTNISNIIDGKTHLKVEFTPKSKTRIFLLPRVLFLHHVGATTRGWELSVLVLWSPQTKCHLVPLYWSEGRDLCSRHLQHWATRTKTV